MVSKVRLFAGWLLLCCSLYTQPMLQTAPQGEPTQLLTAQCRQFWRHTLRNTRFRGFQQLLCSNPVGAMTIVFLSDDSLFTSVLPTVAQDWIRGVVNGPDPAEAKSREARDRAWITPLKTHLDLLAVLPALFICIWYIPLYPMFMWLFPVYLFFSSSKKRWGILTKLFFATPFLLVLSLQFIPRVQPTWRLYELLGVVTIFYRFQ